MKHLPFNQIVTSNTNVSQKFFIALYFDFYSIYLLRRVCWCLKIIENSLSSTIKRANLMTNDSRLMPCRSLVEEELVDFEVQSRKFSQSVLVKSCGSECPWDGKSVLSCAYHEVQTCEEYFPHPL